MDSSASLVQRYRNSFSIENILSKPVLNHNSAEIINKNNNNIKNNNNNNNYDLNLTVTQNINGNLNSAHNNTHSVMVNGGSELRSSSPESSFNEDNLDDAKSDITSEDDHGKIK